MKERKLRYGAVKEETRILRETSFQNDADIADFIGRLEGTRQHLLEPISWDGKHGQRKKIRVMNDIREQRRSQLASINDALDILTAPKSQEVVLYKDNNDKILGFRPITKNGS